MLEKRAQEDQENFRLICQTDIDFNTYTPSAIKIQYMAPGATASAEWDASVLTGGEADGKVKHDFDTNPNQVPAAGTYKIRVKMTVGGKIIYTKPQMWVVGGF